VTVRGDGKGGRNTELAAAFAIEVAGIEGVTCLSAGTDGTDGPTDAAGAIADGQTLAEASLRGLDLGQYLARNDTYTLFKAISGLVVTGPTGTNVMDLQVVLVER
jgi:glycerate-2-kinase